MTTRVISSIYPLSFTGLHPSHRCKRHTALAMPGNDVQMMSKAMTSVGMISYTGMTGTAFRVGTKYVMTAAHIVRDIVGKKIPLDHYINRHMPRIPKFWDVRNLL